MYRIAAVAMSLIKLLKLLKQKISQKEGHTKSINTYTL